MATSTNGVIVPLEEYLNTTYRPDCDWIYGEVRERHMGEGPHAAVQKFFINHLSAREEEWHITVYPEQRVQTSDEKCRVPDVCAVRDDVPFEDVLSIPPVLCIEVMSPGDRMSEVLERVEDYLAMGVKAVWIVDPRRRRSFIADASGVEQATERLTVLGLPIEVELSAVFGYLDKLEARR